MNASPRILLGVARGAAKGVARLGAVSVVKGFHSDSQQVCEKRCVVR